MWILINRLLCLLQPVEELKRSNGPASKSISLSYSSLPPQLTVLKALKSGHIMLASVCMMALLANLLATASAGLFFQQARSISRPALYSPPFQARFANIDGLTGPSPSQSPFLSLSGAYIGGVGEDQFLALESNHTRNASLPSWTDHRAMYLPFRTSTSIMEDPSTVYEARTKYFEVESNCRPAVFGKDYRLNLWDGLPFSGKLSFPQNPYFDAQIQDSNSNNITCYATENALGDSLGRASRRSFNRICRQGRTAAELSATLTARPYASAHKQGTCMSVATLGWMRTTHQSCDIRDSDRNMTNSAAKFEEANATNTFMILCQPQIMIGEASVRVDAAGLLVEPGRDHIADSDQSAVALDSFFTNGAENLIAQSNRFILRSRSSPAHNDTYASEFVHYFMARASGHLRFTNPLEPLPSFQDIGAPLEQAHKMLFAAWLGVNKELLLLPAGSETAPIAGTVVTIEDRLFFVTPLFIISEAILAIYILVSFLVYLRRPGRYLPRMPTSIAAIIALFASSTAVQDLQGTSHMTNKEREDHLKDYQYGYGSYIGSDGAVHVGIEKVPYIRHMEEVNFVGSRVEREIRRRKEKSNVAVATAEYASPPLADNDETESEGQRAASSLDDLQLGHAENRRRSSSATPGLAAHAGTTQYARIPPEEGT